ncbi:MAG: PhzF family phenazine biosynthesis protein [Pseudomonadota bacterium]
MSEYPLTILDVFAERKLQGNQLAVVEHAAALSTEQMQAIALETNFSETTFVTARSPGRATVRIFTPGQELPFAGHPTVGTAWLLSGGQGQIALDLAAGEVAVEFDAAGIGWMTPPPVQFQSVVSAEHAAAALGLAAGDIDANLPVETAEVGPRFLLVPVRNLAALRALRVNMDVVTELSEAGGRLSVFAFTFEAYEAGADIAARMFFDAAGVREDPATGSANTALAAYLRKHQGDRGLVTVDQGVEIGRASRLYLKVGEPIQVGGKVHAVLKGTLTPD